MKIYSKGKPEKQISTPAYYFSNKFIVGYSTGSIKGTDVIPGYKNSFLIETDERVFTVGGRLTRIEDIRLEKFRLNAEKIPGK